MDLPFITLSSRTSGFKPKLETSSTSHMEGTVEETLPQPALDKFYTQYVEPDGRTGVRMVLKTR